MNPVKSRLTSDQFRNAPKVPVRVVLENIRSGLNVGSFFRTADAFRLDAIHLCGYTAQPPHRDILKSALGASEHVTWWHHETTEEAIVKLRKDGYHIAAIEQTSSSVMLTNWIPQPGEKWAFVFGNEVRGVEASTCHAADTCIEIPQFGVKQSLNVSVCGGIILWDAVRKIGLPAS